MCDQRFYHKVSCVCLYFLFFIYLQAEMERALLQGERRAELDQVEAELEIINQIQFKLSEVEKNIQREKEKVNTYMHKRNGLHKLINAFFCT